MSKELFRKTGKRGRPQIVLNYPKAGTFTVNDLVELNPHVVCRLSIYTARNRMIKARILRRTGKTIPTGGVGKPLAELQSMTSFRLSRSLKASAKARKLASIPPVSMDVSEPVPA